jgi:hypothetical protein
VKAYSRSFIGSETLSIIHAPKHKRRHSSKKRVDVPNSQGIQREFVKSTRSIRNGNIRANVSGNIDSMPDIVREMSEEHRPKLVPVKYSLRLIVKRREFSRNDRLRAWLLINGRKLKGRELDLYVFSIKTDVDCPCPHLIKQHRVAMPSTSATPRDMEVDGKLVNTGSRPSRMRCVSGLPTREEIDRREAASDGQLPPIRGLESDDDYGKRCQVASRWQFDS